MFRFPPLSSVSLPRLPPRNSVACTLTNLTLWSAHFPVFPHSSLLPFSSLSSPSISFTFSPLFSLSLPLSHLLSSFLPLSLLTPLPLLSSPPLNRFSPPSSVISPPQLHSQVGPNLTRSRDTLLGRRRPLLAHPLPLLHRLSQPPHHHLPVIQPSLNQKQRTSPQKKKFFSICHQQIQSKQTPLPHQGVWPNDSSRMDPVVYRRF